MVSGLILIWYRSEDTTNGHLDNESVEGQDFQVGEAGNNSKPPLLNANLKKKREEGHSRHRFADS